MDHATGTPAALYLDDLYVGQRFTSGTYYLDEARIKTFAAEFDPQPFHVDDAAARDSLFGGLVASGWHTAAATMRLLATGGLPLANGIIGFGGEILWSKPAKPGDTLHVESEIVEIIPSRSKPDRAVVRVHCVTTNQNGDEVQVFTPKLLVLKRPTSSTTE
jgi:acyl dehydratase